MGQPEHLGSGAVAGGQRGHIDGLRVMGDHPLHELDVRHGDLRARRDHDLVPHVHVAHAAHAGHAATLGEGERRAAEEQGG